jgi:hypothetical protein
LKSIGDCDIYKPQNDDLVDTMLDHNDIIEKEHEGEIDINKIESEVNDKQREDIYEINGARADIPNIFDGSNPLEEATKKANQQKKAD